MSTDNEKVQFVERKTLRTKCIRCNILIRKSLGQIRKIKTEVEAVKYSKLLKRVVTIGEMSCNRCRLHMYKEFRQLEESFVREVSVLGSFSSADSGSSSAGPSFSVETSSSAGPSSSA